MAEAGLGLDELLAFVEQAVQGDRRLLTQLFRTFQQLSHHPTAPDEERRLGEVLSRILIGDRQPDLSGLAPDLREEIQAWLEHLNQVKPGQAGPFES
jgi:hypothetical protein